MSAATAPRTSADVAGQLSERRERQTALEAQLGTVRTQLQQARAARARAMADGKPGASAAVTDLAEQQDALVSALELLAADITQLEGEAADVALDEALATQAHAIDAAQTALDLLEGALRTSLDMTVFPAHDAYSVAMGQAREADRRVARLRRQAAPPSADEPLNPSGAAERIIHRRGRLLDIMTKLRQFAEGP